MSARASLRALAVALALGLGTTAAVRADTAALPPVPPPTPRDRLAAGPQLVVHAFRFRGARGLDSAELERVVEPWRGRPLSSADLARVAAALTRHYREHGFPAAQAFVPDQRPGHGVLELHVDEGELAAIRVDAPRAASARILRRRLERASRGLLDVRALERELRLLRQEGWIRDIDATLRPGPAPGQGELEVRVAETPGWRGELHLANDRSPAIGALGRGVQLLHPGLTGRGDALVARVESTEGLHEWQLGYRLPLGTGRWALHLDAARSRADIVERPFESLDIDSRADTIGIGLAWTALRAPERRLVLEARGELRRSETHLGALRFWPGTDAGDARATVLRLGADYELRAEQSALALRSVLSLGVDALGATSLGRDAFGTPQGDGRFVAWLGQLHWIRRLPPGWPDGELVARLAAQLTPHPLLALERLALGGAGSVRGYRTSELVRDSGLLASLELRLPLWNGPRGLHLSLAPFADLGHGWNRHDTPSVRTLASVGLGLRARWGRRAGLAIYWGHRLRDLPRSRRGLQDAGIHAELVVRSF